MNFAMTTTTIETIPCPDNCDDGYVPPKYERCERCEGRGTIEQRTVVVHDREESKNMVERMIASSVDGDA